MEVDLNKFPNSGDTKKQVFKSLSMFGKKISN